MFSPDRKPSSSATHSTATQPTSQHAATTPPVNRLWLQLATSSNARETASLPAGDGDFEGAGEQSLEKQRPTRRRQQQQATTNVAPPARIEAFFAQDSQIMQSLNPHRSAVNCPATAAAVDEYLGTGAVNPAPGGSPRSMFSFAQQWAPVPGGNLATLLNRPGAYVSVRGTRSQEYANLQGITREHYFVVVNRGGQLWALDAYNHRRIPLGQLLSGDQFQTLEYFRGPFRVQHIPPPALGRP